VRKLLSACFIPRHGFQTTKTRINFFDLPSTSIKTMFSAPQNPTFPAVGWRREDPITSCVVMSKIISEGQNFSIHFNVTRLQLWTAVIWHQNMRGSCCNWLFLSKCRFVNHHRSFSIFVSKIISSQGSQNWFWQICRTTYYTLLWLCFTFFLVSTCGIKKRNIFESLSRL